MRTICTQGHALRAAVLGGSGFLPFCAHVKQAQSQLFPQGLAVGCWGDNGVKELCQLPCRLRPWSSASYPARGQSIGVCCCRVGAQSLGDLLQPPNSGPLLCSKERARWRPPLPALLPRRGQAPPWWLARATCPGASPGRPGSIKPVIQGLGLMSSPRLQRWTPSPRQLPL